MCAANLSTHFPSPGSDRQLDWTAATIASQPLGKVLKILTSSGAPAIDKWDELAKSVFTGTIALDASQPITSKELFLQRAFTRQSEALYHYISSIRVRDLASCTPSASRQLPPQTLYRSLLDTLAANYALLPLSDLLRTRAPTGLEDEHLDAITKSIAIRNQSTLSIEAKGRNTLQEPFSMQQVPLEALVAFVQGVIGYSAKNPGSDITVSLTNVGLSDQQFASFVEALQKGAIQKLDLSNNAISNAAVEMLADTLSKVDFAYTVVLSNNRLSPDCLTAVAKWISNDPPVTIVLKGMGITPAQIADVRRDKVFSIVQG